MQRPRLQDRPNACDVAPADAPVVVVAAPALAPALAPLAAAETKEAVNSAVNPPRLMVLATASLRPEAPIVR